MTVDRYQRIALESGSVMIRTHSRNHYWCICFLCCVLHVLLILPFACVPTAALVFPYFHSGAPHFVLHSDFYSFCEQVCWQFVSSFLVGLIGLFHFSVSMNGRGWHVLFFCSECLSNKELDQSSHAWFPNNLSDSCWMTNQQLDSLVRVWSSP